MSSVKQYAKLRTTSVTRRQIKIFIEYSQCVTERSNFDRVIPEGCPCFLSGHDLGRACYDTPWVVWKIMEFYNKVEKKVEVMRRRIFRPTEVCFLFFYLYIICLTKHNTHFTHLVHNTKHLYYLSNSLHTTDMLPLLLTTHNTQVTHLSHF